MTLKKKSKKIIISLVTQLTCVQHWIAENNWKQINHLFHKIQKKIVKFVKKILNQRKIAIQKMFVEQRKKEDPWNVFP